MIAMTCLVMIYDRAFHSSLIVMLLSHFGDFDCDSSANGTFFSFLSLPTVSTQSQRIRSESQLNVDSGSISGRVKPKTIKISIHSFPA